MEPNPNERLLKERIYNLAIRKEQTATDITEKLGISKAILLKYIMELKKKGIINRYFSLKLPESQEKKINEFCATYYSNETTNSDSERINKLKDRVHFFLIHEKQNMKYITEELGINIETVRRYITKLKKEGRLQQNFTPLLTLLSDEKNRLCSLLLNENKAVEDVAKEFKVSIPTVHKYINTLKKEGRLPNDFSPLKHSKEEIKNRIYQLAWREKKSGNTIADELGYHYASVYNYIRELKAEGRLPQDLSHKNKKVKEMAMERREKVFTLAQQGGKRAEDIASELGVSLSTIRNDVTALKKEGKLPINFSFASLRSTEGIENKILSFVLNKKQTARSIANALNVSFQTVYYHVNNLKKKGEIPADFSFEPEESGAFKDGLENEVLSLAVDKKHTAQVIADSLGISKDMVYYHVRNFKKQGKLPQDFSFISSISKEELKSKVYSLAFQQKKKPTDIASELSISNATVHNYVKELKAEGKLPKDFTFREYRKKNKLYMKECYVVCLRPYLLLRSFFISLD